MIQLVYHPDVRRLDIIDICYLVLVFARKDVDALKYQLFIEPLPVASGDLRGI